MSVVDMVFPTENDIVSDVFYPERARVQIKYVVNSDEYENLLITGAPIMLMELLSGQAIPRSEV